MKQIILTVLLSQLLISCAERLPPPQAYGYQLSSSLMVVIDDSGGYVKQRADYLLALDPGLQVALVGFCFSACTMYLGHPNVCTLDNTEFRFHGPSNNGHPSKDFETASRRMAAFYKEPLRTWFMDVGRMVIGKNGYDFTGADLIKAGLVSRCEKIF